MFRSVCAATEVEEAFCASRIDDVAKISKIAGSVAPTSLHAAVVRGAVCPRCLVADIRAREQTDPFLKARWARDV